MDLGLEIVERVEEVQEGEALPPAPLPPPARMRQSHHLAAQMLAQGMPVLAVAAHTGYAPGRLYAMLKNDPSFKELVAGYSDGVVQDRADLAAQSALVAADLVQDFHERWQDGEIELTAEQQLEAIKVFSDRGGNAPVSRAVSKSLNVHVGIAEAMDRLKARER
jgi:hypothetical protein